MNVISVPENIVKEKAKEVRSRLNEPTEYIGGVYKGVTMFDKSAEPMSFYGLLESIDPESTGRLQGDAAKVAEALEATFSTFHAVYDSIIPSFAGKKKKHEIYDSGETFARSFSLYSGCLSGIEKLGGEDDGKTISLSSLDLKRDGDEIEKDITEMLSQMYAGELKNQPYDGSKLTYLTKVMLSSAAKACINEKSKHPEFTREIEGYSIKVNDLVLNGFEKAVQTQQAEFEPVEWDEIVGNQELKDCMKSLIDKLLLYDPETQKNPIKEISDLPRSVFVYGLPGTGKSLTLKASATYLKKKAERIGKKANFVNIDSGILSKYFGESSKNLREEFAKGTDPSSVNMILIEDIDTIFPSREELRDDPGKKELVGTLLNLIQGFSSKDLGNYVIISTTNKPKGTDSAQNQRLFQKIYEVNGPKNGEEVSMITKKRLSRGIKHGYVAIDDGGWQSIGEVGFENRLVGRDIENVCKSLSDESARIDVDDNIYSLPVEEQKKAILERVGKITTDDVIASMTKYAETKNQHEEKEKAEKVERRLDEILTQYQAMGLFNAITKAEEAKPEAS